MGSRGGEGGEGVGVPTIAGGYTYRHTGINRLHSGIVASAVRYIIAIAQDNLPLSPSVRIAVYSCIVSHANKQTHVYTYKNICLFFIVGNKFRDFPIITIVLNVIQ